MNRRSYWLKGAKIVTLAHSESEVECYDGLTSLGDPSELLVESGQGLPAYARFALVEQLFRELGLEKIDDLPMGLSEILES